MVDPATQGTDKKSWETTAKWGCNTTPTHRAAGNNMRAERDPDEISPRRHKSQPRLAYEIALGIVIGGLVLMAVDAIGNYVAMRLVVNQVQIQFPAIR